MCQLVQSSFEFASQQWIQSLLELLADGVVQPAVVVVCTVPFPNDEHRLAGYEWMQQATAPEASASASVFEYLELAESRDQPILGPSMNQHTEDGDNHYEPLVLRAHASTPTAVSMIVPRKTRW